MTEVFQAAFQPVNLVYTIILLVLLVYWLIAILGLVDVGLFDLDLDVDVDASVDGDVPLLHSAASFFNAGDVPIMFWLSVVALSCWVVSIQVNYFFPLGERQWWLAAALAVPNVIAGMFVAKLVVVPFKNLSRLQPPESQLIGKTCVVVSLELGERIGQCEVRTGGAPVTINASTAAGEILRKGDLAVIVERDRLQDTYTVTRYREEEPEVAVAVPSRQI